MFIKSKTPLLIILGIIAALAISIYWQATQTKIDFANFNPQIPGPGKQLSLPGLNFGSSAEKQNAYKNFASPDGVLSFEYPASFQTGENLLGQAAQDALKLNNTLFFVYRTNIPDIKPTYIIASESNATSTEAIIEFTKQTFAKQQCEADVKTAPSNNNAIAEIIYATYSCPTTQKGFDKWRAQIAIIKKEFGFYTLSAVATAANWAPFQPEAQTLFASVKTKLPKMKTEETTK